MDRVIFRNLIQSIVAAYPVTDRQLMTFAVISSDDDYNSDNLGKVEGDLNEGDFWQRELASNGNDVNKLSVLYPSVTIANNTETITPDTSTVCQGVSSRWLIEVADVIDGVVSEADGTISQNHKQYRPKTVLDRDLITQCRYIIQQVFASSYKHNFLIEPIDIRLSYQNKDNLRIASFELTWNDDNVTATLP